MSIVFDGAGGLGGSPQQRRRGIGTIRWGGPALAALLALILSGCAGSPPSPTASPTPTPTAGPVTEVDALVVRPTGLELRSGGTVVETLDYMSSAQEAVATLTRALGAEPTDEPYEGSPHYPPGLLHRWDGLVLDERFYDEEMRESQGYDYLVWPRFAVIVEGPAAGDATLSTVQGHQAGDDWNAVAADPDFDPDLFVCEGTPVEVEEIDTQHGTKRATVAVAPTLDGGSVAWIRAPAMEADACA